MDEQTELYYDGLLLNLRQIEYMRSDKADLITNSDTYKILHAIDVPDYLILILQEYDVTAKVSGEKILFSKDNSVFEFSGRNETNTLHIAARIADNLKNAEIRGVIYPPEKG